MTGLKCFFDGFVAVIIAVVLSSTQHILSVGCAMSLHEIIRQVIDHMPWLKMVVNALPNYDIGSAIVLEWTVIIAYLGLGLSLLALIIMIYKSIDLICQKYRGVAGIIALYLLVVIVSLLSLWFGWYMRANYSVWGGEFLLMTLIPPVLFISAILATRKLLCRSDCKFYKLSVVLYFVLLGSDVLMLMGQVLVLYLFYIVYEAAYSIDVLTNLMLFTYLFDFVQIFVIIAIEGLYLYIARRKHSLGR
ncbi:MAG: hypothetical protein E7581_03905 [Ruminococcaceae bacterium]|nr:hypothetical protein [Oscillospiraceae bacterium]